VRGAEELPGRIGSLSEGADGLLVREPCAMCVSWVCGTSGCIENGRGVTNAPVG
jgi:hypothetical protein